MCDEGEEEEGVQAEILYASSPTHERVSYSVLVHLLTQIASLQHKAHSHRFVGSLL
jgi:hypothetical protein